MPTFIDRFSWIVFLKTVWAILVETFAHPLSTSVIRVRGGRVQRRRLRGA